MKSRKNFTIVFLFGGLLYLSNCQPDNNNNNNNTEIKNNYVNGSGITSIALTSQKIENLAVLCKVWGFLKYYHPKVAAGRFNWDYELFKILPQIISCEKVTERNKILYSWIYGFGAFQRETEKISDSSDIKCFPDLDWIRETPKLGDSLSKELIEVKNARRTGRNYYVKFTEVGSPVFTNEDSCTQFKYPDLGYRLLCLFRYWNDIEYFYPSKYLIGADWNNVLTEFIPKLINDSNQLAYELTVSEMTARIHDCSASIICNDNTWFNYIGKYIVAAKISFIEDKAVVIDFYDHESAKYSDLEKGDIILKINNKSVDDIVKEWIPFTAASNNVTAMRNIAAILLRSQDSILNITYLRGDSTKSTNVKCSLYNHNFLMESYSSKKDTGLKYLTSQICYIYPNRVKNKYLLNVMPGFMKTKGMIIDFRGNPSEDLLLENYLCFGKISFHKFTSGSVKEPGLFRFNPIVRHDYKNPNYYKGKVVIIVNSETQSYSEYMSVRFRYSPNAIIIGCNTAGENGFPSPITLIGGIQTSISGIGFYYPNGRETQRIGIVPDIEVHPTIKGIREGRDELLEKAIEIINQK